MKICLFSLPKLFKFCKDIFCSLNISIVSLIVFLFSKIFKYICYHFPFTKFITVYTLTVIFFNKVFFALNGLSHEVGIGYWWYGWIEHSRR
jgi:hypothetical protein